MKNFGRISRVLLIFLGLCVGTALFAVFSPGGSPDRIGSAIVVLLGIIGGLMTWSASLVLAILSVKGHETGAGVTLALNITALFVALAGFFVAMEFGWR